MLARQALLVAKESDDWSQSKLTLARVYASQVLAQAPGLAESVMAGPEDYEAGLPA